MSGDKEQFPLLSRATSFIEWRSNAKAVLKAKEVWSCITSSGGEGETNLMKDKASGILWKMLSPDVQPLVREHEDEPKLLWEALERIFAPRKAGARFNAYRTLTSIRLRDDESLLALTGRVSVAMRLLKDSRSKGFTLEKADEELQAVVLLMALPDDERFSALKSPFEQSSDDLKVSSIEEAYTNYQSFRTAHQEGDTSQINPLSGQAMVTVPLPSSSVAAPAVAPPITCAACGKDHNLLQCPPLLELIGKKQSKQHKKGNKAAPQVAPNASLLTHSTLSSADKRWNADSGCTSHMTHCREYLLNAKPYRIPIEVANGVVVYSELVGEVLLVPLIKGRRGRSILLTFVLYVPGLSHNLISTTYLSRVHGLSIVMEGCNISFERGGKVLFEADIDERNRAYVREDDSYSVSALVASSTLPLDLDLLHRRLGHHSDTQRILSKNLVTGAKVTSNQKLDPICEPCLAGKLNAAPFPSTGHRAAMPLDLIHSDLKEYKVFTREGWRYRVIFRDDHTSFTVGYHMKRKSGTFTAFKLFKAYAENHFGRKIKALQDDEGGEYMSTEFGDFLASEGIVRRHSTRNRPQQNGTAERANRTIDEHATAMLHEANLPPSFRALAVSAYIHVGNMHPTSHIPEDTTPHELWFKQKPDVSHLRVWGCLAYVHVQKDKRDASGIHIQKCIFVGYPTEYKGWSFYNPVTRKIVVSEHTVFDERYFPGNSPAQMRQCPRIPPHRLPSLPPYQPPQSPAWISDLDDDDDHPSHHNVPPAHPPTPPPPTPKTASSPSPPTSPSPPPSPIGVAARRRFHGQTTEHRPPQEFWRVPSMTPHPTPSPAPESDDELLLQPGSAMIVAHEGNPECPVLQAANVAAVQSANAAVNSDNPHSYHEAMRRSDAHLWKDAAVSEINSLLENCTWDVVDPPPGVKPIRSQWVFIKKYKSDGSIERYKARLVADGRGQRHGIDYNEIFSPTFKPATLRTILALAAQDGLKLRSIDFSTAYLNGDLDEDVYMTQPEGFPQGERGQLLKLLRSIYGLKQAGRQWNKKLSKKLLSMGFKCLQSDRSCYLYSNGTVNIILPIYVDDGTIAAKSDADIDKVIAQLGESFKVKDLGPTEWLLGIKIEQDPENGDIHISQRQYAVNMLEQYGMADCKPVDTPMLPGLVLSKEMGAKTEEESKRYKGIYLSAVGSLLYLATQTRPDISYTVGLLARFNSNPGETHWKAVKHLFRYIQGTLDFRITYSKSSPTTPHRFLTYADANHGGCPDSGKSTGGYLVMMNGGPVSWKSKLQTTVALSTTEAEYVAAVEGGKEIKWMRNLLYELGYSVSGSSPLMLDNQSAIAVSKNPEHHGRMKHLDLAHYWLRDEVETGTIRVEYVPTQDQLADILTKALPRPAVLHLRKQIGLRGS